MSFQQIALAMANVITSEPTKSSESPAKTAGSYRAQAKRILHAADATFGPLCSPGAAKLAIATQVAKAIGLIAIADAIDAIAEQAIEGGERSFEEKLAAAAAVAAERAEIKPGWAAKAMTRLVNIERSIGVPRE